MWSLLSPRMAHHYPKPSSRTSIKRKIRNKFAAESWSPAKHFTDPQSVSLQDRCSAWSTSSRPSSRSSASSVTGHALQVHLEDQKQVVKKTVKKGYLHLIMNLTVQSYLHFVMKNSKPDRSSKRATSVLPRSNLSCCELAFFPELHHSSLQHPELLAPRPTPGSSWSRGELQTLTY